MVSTFTYAPKVSDNAAAEIAVSTQVKSILASTKCKLAPQQFTYLAELKLTDRTKFYLANDSSLSFLFDGYDSFDQVKVWDLLRALDTSYTITYKGWTFALSITYRPQSIRDKQSAYRQHKDFLKAAGLDGAVCWWFNPKSTPQQNAQRLETALATEIAKLQFKTPRV